MPTLSARAAVTARAQGGAAMALEAVRRVRKKARTRARRKASTARKAAIATVRVGMYVGETEQLAWPSSIASGHFSRRRRQRRAAAIKRSVAA